MQMNGQLHSLVALPQEFQVPIEYEVVGLEPVWALWRKEKYLAWFQASDAT
jgi:hypothetical protein